MDRWEGRGGRGGASGLVGGAREGRWLQLRRTASAAALCFGRGGEGGEAGREGRGAWESEGGQGDRDGLRKSSTRPGARRQAGGGRAAVRVRARSSFGARGGRRRRAAVVGWAACWLGRPAGWAAQGGAQVSFSLLIIFCFLISDICFDLNKILNHFITLCQFLQELDILFQSSPTGGIIFGHILIYITNIFPIQIFMH